MLPHGKAAGRLVRMATRRRRAWRLAPRHEFAVISDTLVGFHDTPLNPRVLCSPMAFLNRGSVAILHIASGGVLGAPPNCMSLQQIKRQKTPIFGTPRALRGGERLVQGNDSSLGFSVFPDLHRSGLLPEPAQGDGHRSRGSA